MWGAVVPASPYEKDVRDLERSGVGLIMTRWWVRRVDLWVCPLRRLFDATDVVKKKIPIPLHISPALSGGPRMVYDDGG